MGWWRVQGTQLRGEPAATRLRDAYRTQALANTLREAEIERCIARLRSAGIEAILVKGRAACSVYANPDLRPCGDIDLLVRPDQRARAEDLLRGEPVDLEHGALAKLRRPWDDLLARSRWLRIGDTDVRVLSPEDHLAFLSLHLLWHGGWRPLWLCDVAAALEARPSTFDWEICLGDDERIRDWIACAIGLAHQVLGAEIGDAPVADRANNLPSWLVPALLRQWETPCYADHPLGEESILVGLVRPWRVLGIVRERWWDPIQVTVWADAAFDERSRVPLQLRNLAWQAVRLAKQLPARLRTQS
jgi:hypothetical protein